MKNVFLSTASALLLMVSAAAQAVVIDFESDATGFGLQDVVSDDAPFVTFRDTMGDNLSIYDYGSQGIGQSLAVNGDDGSKLEILVAGGATEIVLSFGNDDPAYSNTGDRAWLQLFDGAAMVHEHWFVMNRNDIMDQAIGKSGIYFDRAVFFYGDAGGNAINLIEIVDNVRIQQAVPAPAGVALVLLGLAGMLVRRRTV